MRVMKRAQWIGVGAMLALVAMLAMVGSCVSNDEPESPAAQQELAGQQEPAVQQVQQDPAMSERASERSLGVMSLYPPPGEAWYEGPRVSPNCFWTCLNGAHGEATLIGVRNCPHACQLACGHPCTLR